MTAMERVRLFRWRYVGFGRVHWVWQVALSKVNDRRWDIAAKADESKRESGLVLRANTQTFQIRREVGKNRARF